MSSAEPTSPHAAQPPGPASRRTKPTDTASPARTPRRTGRPAARLKRRARRLSQDPVRVRPGRSPSPRGDREASRRCAGRPGLRTTAVHRRASERRRLRPSVSSTSRWGCRSRVITGTARWVNKCRVVADRWRPTTPCARTGVRPPGPPRSAPRACPRASRRSGRPQPRGAPRRMRRHRARPAQLQRTVISSRSIGDVGRSGSAHSLGRRPVNHARMSDRCVSCNQ